MNPLLVDIDEAMRVTRIRRSKLYAEIMAGRLKSVKIGRSRRIAVADLEAYVNRLRAEAYSANETPA